MFESVELVFDAGGQLLADDGPRQRRAVAVGAVLMRAAAAVIAFALAGAVAGCDWRDFDNLKNGTPVLAVSAPSDYPAGDDFGPILLPLDPPTDGSATPAAFRIASRRSGSSSTFLSESGSMHGGISLTRIPSSPSHTCADRENVTARTPARLGRRNAQVDRVIVRRIGPDVAGPDHERAELNEARTRPIGCGSCTTATSPPDGAAHDGDVCAATASRCRRSTARAGHCRWAAMEAVGIRFVMSKKASSPWNTATSCRSRRCAGT